MPENNDRFSNLGPVETEQLAEAVASGGLTGTDGAAIARDTYGITGGDIDETAEDLAADALARAEGLADKN